MKKFLPLLFLPVLILIPHSAYAGLSEMCSPSVECDKGKDYFAGSCQDHIETLANCPFQAPPGEFLDFSCNYGCYSRTTPSSEECAAGVMVNGKCMTTTYLVDDKNVDKIWDGSTLTPLGGGGSDVFWKTDNNTDIYRSTGKVGIGTNVPNYKVDIAGDLNLNKESSGAALYASSRQMLWFNPDPALNYVAWGNDAGSNFFGKRVGIGALADSDFMLDVKGAVNINKELSGAALYASTRQMLWFNPDPAFNFVAWGNDAGSNFFGKPVGIGAINQGTFSKLYASNVANTASTVTSIQSNTTNSGSGFTYGNYNIASNSGTGNVSGNFVTATKTGTGDVYGTNSYATQSAPGNQNKAYGVYALASNVANVCGGNCPEAIGVYGSTSNTQYGTGGYFEGNYVGLHAVGKSSPLNSIGLWVENNDLNSNAALFECTGSNCTSGIFKNGSDSTANITNSGIVIVGDPAGAHLSIDKDGLMAKSNGYTVTTLSLNPGTGGKVLVNMDGEPSAASSVCRNGEILGFCSSLRKLKKNIEDLSLGLDTVMQLKPVSFDWKDPNVKGRDLGFIAEDIEAVNPLLAQYDDGKLTGVKYEKLTSLLTKAIQDLKKQKDKEISELKKSNLELTKLVCLDHPEAELCKNK